jgi:hypothetical protein
VSYCAFAIKIKEMNEKPDKSWTVVRLKAYLKENGGRCGGRKQDLLDLAILYFDDFESGLGSNSTAATITEAQLTSERQIFENRTIIWQNVLEKKPEVPSLFDLMTINSFLSETTFNLGGEDDDDDEPIQSGTAKPVRKGRQMYSASKIQVCESGQHGDLVVFRCTMEASMKTNVFR